MSSRESEEELRTSEKVGKVVGEVRFGGNIDC